MSTAMDTSLDSAAATVAPPQTSVLFARGVIACLALWSAMRIAVADGWGGPESAQKRTWLAGVIVDAFEEQMPAPDAEYVEDLLLQVMADEFDAELQDGSAAAVSRDIVRLWGDVHLGRVDAVLALERQADAVKGKRPSVQMGATSEGEWDDEDGEDDDDESSEEEVPRLLPDPSTRRAEPEIDEDGFTLVKGKGRR